LNWASSARVCLRKAHRIGRSHAQSRFEVIARRVEAASVSSVLKLSIRFAGEPGERGTIFFNEPSRNPIEMSGFTAFDGAFAK
jgi:uncharacterized protein